MIIPVKTRDGGYDIIMELGALARVGEMIGESGAGRLSLIVTDDGVPAQYAETVAAACRANGRAEILTVPFVTAMSPFVGVLTVKVPVPAISTSQGAV